ncbi:hypothetical protein AAMO2058_001409400 [Amorphochlora amoebiformis]
MAFGTCCPGPISKDVTGGGGANPSKTILNRKSSSFSGLSVKNVMRNSEGIPTKLLLKRDNNGVVKSGGATNRLKDRLRKRKDDAKEVPLTPADVRIGLRVRLGSGYKKSKRDYVVGPGEILRDDGDGWVMVQFESRGICHLHQIKHLVIHPKKARSSLESVSVNPIKCAPVFSKSRKKRPKKPTPNSTTVNLTDENCAPIFVKTRNKKQAKKQGVKLANAEEKKPKKIHSFFTKNAIKCGNTDLRDGVKNPYSSFPKAPFFMSKKERRKRIQDDVDREFKADIQDSRLLAARLSDGKESHWFLTQKFATPANNTTLYTRTQAEITPIPCPFPPIPHTIPSPPTLQSCSGSQQPSIYDWEPITPDDRLPSIRSSSTDVDSWPLTTADVSFDVVENRLATSSETIEVEDIDPLTGEPASRPRRPIKDLEGCQNVVAGLANMLNMSEKEVEEQLLLVFALRNGKSKSTSHAAEGKDFKDFKCLGSDLWTECFMPTFEIWRKSSTVVNGLQQWITKNWLDQSKRMEPIYSESDADFEDDLEYEYFPCGRNSVLLHGPSGSGKTCSVYVCCKQLGFSVLEINTSKQRSGAELAKVCKEATQSHLLTLSSSFFGSPKSKSKSKAKARRGSRNKRGRVKFLAPEAKKLPASGSGSNRNKTLILVDEIDSIFGSDCGFYSSLRGLIKNTKRPIVMTCNEIPEELDSANIHSHITMFPMQRPPARQIFKHVILIALAITGFPAESQPTDSLEKLSWDIRELIYLFRRDIRRILMSIHFWLPQLPASRVVRSLRQCSKAISPEAFGRLKRIKEATWSGASGILFKVLGLAGGLSVFDTYLDKTFSLQDRDDHAKLIERILHLRLPLVHLNYLDFSKKLFASYICDKKVCDMPQGLLVKKKPVVPIASPTRIQNITPITSPSETTSKPEEKEVQLAIDDRKGGSPAGLDQKQPLVMEESESNKPQRRKRRRLRKLSEKLALSKSQCSSAVNTTQCTLSKKGILRPPPYKSIKQFMKKQDTGIKANAKDPQSKQPEAKTDDILAQNKMSENHGDQKSVSGDISPDAVGPSEVDPGEDIGKSEKMTVLPTNTYTLADVKTETKLEDLNASMGSDTENELVNKCAAALVGGNPTMDSGRVGSDSDEMEYQKWFSESKDLPYNHGYKVNYDNQYEIKRVPISPEDLHKMSLGLRVIDAVTETAEVLSAIDLWPDAKGEFARNFIHECPLELHAQDSQKKLKKAMFPATLPAKPSHHQNTLQNDLNECNLNLSLEISAMAMSLTIKNLKRSSIVGLTGCDDNCVKDHKHQSESDKEFVPRFRQDHLLRTQAQKQTLGGIKSFMQECMSSPLLLWSHMGPHDLAWLRQMANSERINSAGQVIKISRTRSRKVKGHRNHLKVELEFSDRTIEELERQFQSFVDT